MTKKAVDLATLGVGVQTVGHIRIIPNQGPHCECMQMNDRSRGV